MYTTWFIKDNDITDRKLRFKQMILQSMPNLMSLTNGYFSLYDNMNIQQEP